MSEYVMPAAFELWEQSLEGVHEWLTTTLRSDEPLLEEFT
jgi:hypothetical protein